MCNELYHKWVGVCGKIGASAKNHSTKGFYGNGQHNAAGNKVRRISQIFGDVVRRYRNREITLRAAASLCGMSPASFWRKSRGFR